MWSENQKDSNPCSWQQVDLSEGVSDWGLLLSDRTKEIHRDTIQQEEKPYSKNLTHKFSDLKRYMI